MVEVPDPNPGMRVSELGLENPVRTAAPARDTDRDVSRPIGSDHENDRDPSPLARTKPGRYNPGTVPKTQRENHAPDVREGHRHGARVTVRCRHVHTRAPQCFPVTSDPAVHGPDVPEEAQARGDRRQRNAANSPLFPQLQRDARILRVQREHH